MNVLHSAQEKRTIKVKDFLEDFRSGITDAELMDKHHLTSAGLDKFYAMLLDREILHQSDFEQRVQGNVAEEPIQQGRQAQRPRFYCPSCLASQETIFDMCPECGFDLHDSGGRSSTQSNQGEVEPMTDACGCAGEAPGQGTEAKKDPLLSPLGNEMSVAPGPIEIPLKDSEEDDLFHGSDWDSDKELFGEDSSEFKKIYSSFDDAVDHVVPGMPLDYQDPTYESADESKFRCLHCEGILEAGVRKMFDQRGSLWAFAAAVLLLVLGLFGGLGLTLFDGYSLLRVGVVYLTGISMLLGSALMAIALFMVFLAWEQVYLCNRCGRTYPRV